MWTYTYNLDPVLIHLGPLTLRWYGLAYVAGFLFTWWYYKKILAPKQELPFSQERIPDILLTALLGLLIGARLVYMTVYNTQAFLANPLQTFAIWEGGLSFHGALLGIIIALLGYLSYHKISILSTADRLILPVPLALFFGRIANFINGELIGRPLEGQPFPLCVIYPPESICRYPSQLLQAATEGLLLFVLLQIAFWYTPLRKYAGSTFGLFLALYGAFRFCTEYFRAPDPQVGLLWDAITMGQLLCLPMILVGLFFVLFPVLRRS